jgi:cell division control protein 45
VIDSHRPLDLDNVESGNESVLVLRDAREQVPGTGTEAFPAAESGSEGEGEAEEEEAGSSDRENEDGRRVRQRTAGASRREKARAHHACTHARMLPRARAHARCCARCHALTPPLRSRCRAAQRAAARAARAEYYARGSFYGRPAACIVYDLAHALRRDGLEHHSPLWHAVCGLTDQYTHGRCSHDAYTSAVFELANRVADAPSADAPRTVALEDGSTVAAFARRRLGYAREFRFAMLRHWSLYDAMLHAPHIAVRLQTWTEPGRRALDRLLAEMGLPLAECRQKFSHMSPACLKALQSRMEAMAPAYGLGDVMFWSFTKQHGYKLDVCASDVVYGVTALLEMGASASGGGDAAAGEAARDAGSGAGNAGFWRAVDALSEAHWDTLREGLAHAQRLQRAVMRHGGLALLGKRVANAGAFRFLNLAAGGAAAGGGGDAALLRQPQALLRLALFVQDAVHVSRSARSHKPLVLAAPCGPLALGDDAAASAQDMVLVVGVSGQPRVGDARGNGFGNSFHVAAAAVRAPFAHDAFEAAVITVAASHLEAFLDQLHHEELERRAM